MRIKRYQATTVAGAMALIRAELGPDALILAVARSGRGVEVTAALEPEPLDTEPAPQPADTSERDRLLHWHGVPDHMRPSLMAADLISALATRFRFAPMLAGDRPRPLMVAGPPGAGKTLTIARLATRLVMAGTPLMVITADGQRAGAAEQLQAFTRVLGVDLLIADQAALLGRLVARRTDEAVLIDTPGLNPTDPAANDLVSAWAVAGAATTALVLPGGLEPNEAADLAEAFAAAGATHLVATRLDISRRLGGILAAADAGRLALSEAGVGPGAADGLQALTPAFLAARLLAPTQTNSFPKGGAAHDAG